MEYDSLSSDPKEDAKEASSSSISEVAQPETPAAGNTIISLM